MKINRLLLPVLMLAVTLINCENASKETMKKGADLTAAEILGNPDYLAISYGGYRQNTRDIQPTVAELKDDMKLLHAMGVRILRTYNVHLAQAGNILVAIRELKKEDPEFEMYVMLGAWIDAKNAWTDEPDRIRNVEAERNAIEIDKAVALANEYPDIVKILAVGNEAMVHWAWEYYVEPAIILKWVTYLQDLKKQGRLPETLWITSSDNFASWGGGGEEYHLEDLNKLIEAVDYISMHTYPMHDTHYHPVFWGVKESEQTLSKKEQVDAAMQRSLEYAISQYDSVVSYMKSLGVDKPIHIGESGWATLSNDIYGNEGSKALDEYKAGVYYKLIREWSAKKGISVFYFEAFDEPWKDAANELGSENHFGLFKTNGEAKYAIWDLVDADTFEGLTRDGNPITKSYGGDFEQLMETVQIPPVKEEIMVKY